MENYFKKAKTFESQLQINENTIEEIKNVLYKYFNIFIRPFFFKIKQIKLALEMLN